MDDKIKIRRYVCILNKKDFEFLDSFCEKEKIIRGKNYQNKLAYLLNEYKSFLKEKKNNGLVKCNI
jgi:hypothetical protein